MDKNRMIHYHSADVSGKLDEAHRFLRGRHAMISFAHQGKLAIALDVCQSIALDNGAFSTWRGGREPVDFDAYFAWAKALSQHPGFDWCLIPDVINGTEADNVELVTKWVRIGPPFMGIPVWHMHESLDWLSYLVTRFQRVAIGSSGQWPTPGTPAWWRRMGDAMATACDSQGRPRCKLHGLRMLDPAIFTRLPLSSADSSNAGMNAGAVTRFGLYPHPSAATRAAIIADRIEAHNSAPCWQESGQGDLLQVESPA